MVTTGATANTTEGGEQSCIVQGIRVGWCLVCFFDDVYPRETPPHIRTARASPQRHTAAGKAAPTTADTGDTVPQMLLVRIHLSNEGETGFPIWVPREFSRAQKKAWQNSTRRWCIQR